MSGTIIGQAEFDDLRRRTPAPTILEVRRTRSPQESGVHIVGAVPIHLDTDLQGRGGGSRGSRPLPDDVALQESLRSWGIGPAGAVVYTLDGLAVAARAWLVLRLAGIEVSVLDPGADRVPTDEAPGEIRSIDAEEAEAYAESGLLLDARGTANYSSEHIPGAVSAPASDLLDASGHLLNADALRDRFAGIGVTAGVSVASYCGGGVAASLEALALSSIGIPSSVYVASWSGWIEGRKNHGS